MAEANYKTADRELRVIRSLNASTDLVWEIWTNPQHVANWWGPEGFTNIIHTMSLVPGGEWLLTMQGPDGKRFPNKSVFVEIVALEKIVFQHFNPNYVATIAFTAAGKKTFVDWTMVFETKELFETVVKVFKADEGLAQNVDKLERYLQQLVSQ